MVKKKTKRNILVGGLILTAMVLIGLFSGLFAIGFDDYLVEEDFSINRPALVQQSSVCQMVENDFVCKDSLWTNTITKSPTLKSGERCDIKQENGYLFLVSNEGVGNCRAIYLNDLSNKDVKIDATVTATGRKTNLGISSFSIGSYSGSLIGISATQDYTVELVKDFNNPDIWHIQVNGKEVGTTSTAKTLTFSLSSTISGTMKINSIKSRPYFNCKVESDEVVIKDVFKEGSTFSITDLTYTPVKFCPDNYPAIKRSLTAEGTRADIQGQLTRTLTKGGSITVNKGESIEMYYIADYKTGMGERCSLGQAYDTKTKQCSQIVTEKEDIIKVVNTKEVIVVGKNDILFKNNINIADKQITSTKPSYSCATQDDNANAPSPSNSCWKTQVSYNGQSYTLIYGEEKTLDSFFKIKYLPKADYKDGKVQDDYVNNFILTVLNDKLLEVTTIQDSDYYILKDKPKQIQFKVKNNLGTFKTGDSGVQIKETKQLLTQQKTYQKNIAFKKGEDTYSITIDSSEYGKIDYEINFWYKVGDNVVFDDEKVVRNFNIVNSIPTDTKLVTSADATVVTGEKSIWTKIWEWIKNLFS